MLTKKVEKFSKYRLRRVHWSAFAIGNKTFFFPQQQTRSFWANVKCTYVPVKYSVAKPWRFIPRYNHSSWMPSLVLSRLLRKSNFLLGNCTSKRSSSIKAIKAPQGHDCGPCILSHSYVYFTFGWSSPHSYQNHMWTSRRSCVLGNHLP